MAFSYDSYTGDGITTQFAVTFGYIAQSDVTVTVDGVSVSFTWDNAAQVNCAVAPANGAAVVVQRDTQKTSRLVDFTAASILDEASLDKDSNQLFYISQEAYDDLSNALQYDPDTGEYDANNKRIKNLADAVSNDEAVNLGQIASQISYAAEWANKAEDSLVSAAAGGDQVDDYSSLHHKEKALDAQTAAETAQTAAETAQGLAETAQSDAETAETNAQTAQTNAETAETNAETAESMAEEWAEKAEDSAITGNPGKYSAYHWAQKSEDFAAAATISGGTTDNIVSINSSDAIVDSGIGKANVGQLNVAAEWTKQQNINEAAITSTSNATAWNTDDAQCALHTLTENTTISAPTNLNAGSTYVLRVVQAAGLYTLAFNAVFKWGTADTPTAPAGSGDVVIFSFYSDGTNMYGVEFIREEA
jgi:hypothetical protein